MDEHHVALHNGKATLEMYKLKLVEKVLDANLNLLNLQLAKLNQDEVDEPTLDKGASKKSKTSFRRPSKSAGPNMEENAPRATSFRRPFNSVGEDAKGMSRVSSIFRIGSIANLGGQSQRFSVSNLMQKIRSDDPYRTTALAIKSNDSKAKAMLTEFTIYLEEVVKKMPTTTAFLDAEE